MNHKLHVKHSVLAAFTSTFTVAALTTLLGVSVPHVAFAQSSKEVDAVGGSTDARRPGTTSTASGGASAAGPEVAPAAPANFTPSESVSADQAIDFPADI